MSEMIENTGMDRQKLKTFILETYPASADRPWLQYPNYEVFRHSSNQKWFAVIMDLPKSKLGLQGEERVDAVNLKCGPILAGSLLMENGFFQPIICGRTVGYLLRWMAVWRMTKLKCCSM